MNIGSLFGLGSDKGRGDEEYSPAGYLRVAFPVWSIPGVRVVADLPDNDKTTRSELEDLFNFELGRFRSASKYSAVEASELEVARSLRRALYDVRAAA